MQRVSTSSDPADPSPTTTSARQPPHTVRASRVREGSHVVIIGGGPGGYEAALVARQLDARVTIVEKQGIGGAAVLTDVVPSKTLIATAERMTVASSAPELGIRQEGSASSGPHTVDLAVVNARVKDLARRQSEDIRSRLERDDITLVALRQAAQRGRLDAVPGT